MYRDGNVKDCIRVGMFGMGVVGTGVVELLQKNRETIEKRVGMPVRIVKSVVANKKKKRNVDISSIALSDDLSFILDDPEIDIVLELMGGIEPAEKVILSALKNGKSVVTANKALLAERARVIFPAAYDARGHFGFETSVGGGIPIIRTMREGFAGDEIQEISGIMNGTANYILSRMTAEGIPFHDVLKEAQKQGYAETNPTFDIEGYDTAHKLIILMHLAFSGYFDYQSLYVEGIAQITLNDIEYARELGYQIKLLGKARKTKQGIEGRVHPTMVPNTHMLATVSGAFNAISVHGNFVGPIMLHGSGAGAYPSASAVVSDLVEACRFQLYGQKTPLPPISVQKKNLKSIPIVPIGDVETEYYLRFPVKDKIGVLWQIAKILSENHISIRFVIQRNATYIPGKPVDVVIVTHTSVEKNVQNAIKAIDLLPFMTDKTKLIRMDPD